jgi:tight adherence protein C
MIFLLFLAGLFLVAVAASLLVRAVAVPRLRAEETLGRIDDYGFTGGAQPVEREASIFGPFDALASGIGAALTVRFGTRRADEARKHLAGAGLYDVEPRKLIGYQAMSGALALLLWLWVASGSFSTLVDVAGIGACGYVGFAFPMLLVKRRARRRLEDIEYDLPELIDLLVVAVEAGLAFGAALKAASDRLKGPLGEEMRLSLQEQNMGLSAIEALKNVLTRAETPSVRSFVRAIIQGEQLGISIGQVLRNLAEEMRKRRKAAAEERAQKAPIKMLFPLIFLIFPAMFVILLGPAVFAFLEALG